MYTVRKHGGQQRWAVYIYSIDSGGNEDFELVHDGFSNLTSAFAFINYLNGGDGRAFTPLEGP